MLQTRTWSFWDPKYLVQTLSEAIVKSTATFFVTVSDSYKQYLISSDHIQASRIATVPCIPNEDHFFVDPIIRSRIRSHLSLDGKIVLIYIGKFGGLYYDYSHLQFWAPLFNELSLSVFLIILTPQDPFLISSRLRKYGIAESQFLVTHCHHSEVNNYLNAADIGISFINSGPWSFACSPVKHGEYWACGLPLIMPTGIGDEREWLESDKLGFLANYDNSKSISTAFNNVLDLINDSSHRSRIQSLGRSRRNVSMLHSAYNRIFDFVALY
jgi:glycosyltransferase involved in cell wall biosynthesis